MSAFGPMPNSGSLGKGPMEAADGAALSDDDDGGCGPSQAGDSRVRCTAREPVVADPDPMSYDSRAEISARCYTRVRFDRVNLSFLEMSRAALNG